MLKTKTEVVGFDCPLTSQNSPFMMEVAGILTIDSILISLC